jgi:hypothetical protein
MIQVHLFVVQPVEVGDAQDEAVPYLLGALYGAMGERLQGKDETGPPGLEQGNVIAPICLRAHE